MIGLFVVKMCDSKKVWQRKIERVYWIVVILTEDWNKDNCITELAARSLTRYIIISRPVYHKFYDKKVRYATF